MSETTVYREVVKLTSAGAKLLDEKKPDWYKHEFDWENFNINLSSSCVLGQLNGGLYDSYWKMMKEFFPGLPRYSNMQDAAAVEHGFATGSMNLVFPKVSRQDFALLYKQAWQGLVLDRLRVVDDEVDYSDIVPADEPESQFTEWELTLLRDSVANELNLVRNDASMAESSLTRAAGSEVAFKLEALLAKLQS